MNGQIDDKAFEEYLKRGSPVSQHYQALESDEMPADIDSQILAQAEEAVRSPWARKARAWQRWSVPVALAASTVLAISIAIESGQHESTLTRAPSYVEPAQDTSSVSQQIEERKAEPSVEPQVVKPVAAPTAASEKVRAGAAEREREAKVLRDQVQPRSEALSVAAPPSMEARAERAGPEAESDAVADTPVERAWERRADELNDQVTQTATRAPRPAPVMPAPSREVQRSQTAVTSARTENPGFISEQQNGDAQRSDPEAWLREIRELRAAGKTAEADREWKAFREVFPDHVVAEDDPAITP